MLRLLVLWMVLTSLSLGCATSHSRTIDADGARIHIVEKGHGPPVVLIHGYWDSIDLTWGSTGIIDALAADHRVLAIDCRGHGASDKPHDPGAYGTEMVRDVARAMDDASMRSAHIVGHSMGAMITLRFAVEFPERARSITLIGAGAAPPGGDPTLMARIAEALERNPPTLRPIIEFIWPAGAPGPTEQEVAEIDAAAFATNDPLALAAVARGFGALTVTDVEARAITAPALAVVGAADPMIADVHRLHGVMGDHLEVIEVPEADHMSILARTELVAAIRAHIDGAQRAAR